MFDVVIPGMIIIRKNTTEIILKGRSTRGRRCAERLALVGSHIAELALFDAGVDAEVVPTTQYLGSGAYAPVVMVRIVH